MVAKVMNQLMLVMTVMIIDEECLLMVFNFVSLGPFMKQWLPIVFDDAYEWLLAMILKEYNHTCFLVVGYQFPTLWSNGCTTDDGS